MSWFHLVFTVNLVSSLPPVSSTAAMTQGEIPGVADPVVFMLGDSLFYLAVFYSLDPEHLEQGSYDAEITVKKEGAKAFTEKWSRRLGSLNTLYLVDYKDLVLTPGKYTLSMVFSSGRNQGALSTVVKVPRDTGLVASGVMFASRFYDRPEDAPFSRGNVGFVPNPTRAFWGDTLYYYFEIYGLSGKYVLTTGVEDPQGKVLISTKPSVKEAPGPSAAEAGKLDISSLETGEYSFVAEVLDMGRGKKIRIEKPFAKKTRAERYVLDPIRSFIQYIASEEEMAEFKACKTDEQRVAFLDMFWASRDPDPSTPENEFYDEFVARVRYADEHFSHVNRPGRLTDMGRIYIKYGPPDEVEREDMPKSNKANIHWKYYLHTWEFLFGDPDNTGEYRLVYSTNPQERPTLYYDKPPTKFIDEETEEWYWPW